MSRGSEEEEFWRSGGFPIARGLECALKFLTPRSRLPRYLLRLPRGS